jgi:SAM-dependent methyltransferase
MNVELRIDQALQTLTRPIRTASMRKQALHEVRVNERSVEYSFTFGQMAAIGTGRLLDVGTGKSAFPALASLAGWQVVAVDNVIDFWKRGPLGIRIGLFNEHFSVEDRDLIAKPLPPEFDLVTCISTFEHVHRRAELFSSMCGALVPGGKLILTTPYSAEGGVPNVYLRPESDAFGKHIPYICQILDRDEIDRLCLSSGMEIEEIQYWQFWEGRYWSEGRPLPQGVRSREEESHDLVCLAISKTR